MSKLKNTKIEFHILQSFPVSCLNRDDVGSPKSAMIGGVNRARVSSQCWKRQVRLALHDLGIKLGIRTKNLTALLVKSLEKAGATSEQSEKCAEAISKVFSDDTLIFISEHELSHFAEYAKNKGFNAKDLNSKELTKLNNKYLNKNLDALDIALFGRMVAKANDMDVEAATSFNHAISTHAVSTDIDYFTALDDFSDDQGAAHLGATEFNSATYYRYVCLDLGILAHNLGIEDIHSDLDSIKIAVENFIKALILAVPSARQNTMSAASTWDYAKILVREGGQALQLNFDKPVKARGEGYLKPSIEELQSQIKNKQNMLGSLYACKAELEWGLNDNYSIDNLISDVEASL